VGGLVEADFAAAWDFECSFPSPRCFGNFSTLNFFRFKRAHGCVQVVAHEVNDRAQKAVIGVALQVTLAFFFGMQGSFSGRQREDEPSVTGIDCAKIEDVAEENAICVGVCAVEQYVSTGNHGFLL